MLKIFAMANAPNSTNEQQQQQCSTLTIRLIMQGKEVGSIIGKKGENIKKFREESGAKINISDGSCPERIVTLMGTSEAVQTAFEMMCKKLEEQDTDADASDVKDSSKTIVRAPITLRLAVPANQCGSLIGKGGSKIREIRELTGTSIQVASESLPNSTERGVTISGMMKSLVHCMATLCKIILESPSKGPNVPYTPRPAGHGPVVYTPGVGPSGPPPAPPAPAAPHVIPGGVPIGLPTPHPILTPHFSASGVAAFQNHHNAAIRAMLQEQALAVQQHNLLLAAASQQRNVSFSGLGPWVPVQNNPQTAAVRPSLNAGRPYLQTAEQLEESGDAGVGGGGGVETDKRSVGSPPESGNSPPIEPTSDAASPPAAGASSTPNIPSNAALAPTNAYKTTISNALIGCIIGKAGSKINEIRQLSGATVRISDPEEGKEERKILISGNHDSVLVAQFLIHTCIELHEKQQLAAAATDPSKLAAFAAASAIHPQAPAAAVAAALASAAPHRHRMALFGPCNELAALVKGTKMPVPFFNAGLPLTQNPATLLASPLQQSLSGLATAPDRDVPKGSSNPASLPIVSGQLGPNFRKAVQAKVKGSEVGNKKQERTKYAPY